MIYNDTSIIYNPGRPTSIVKFFCGDFLTAPDLSHVTADSSLRGEPSRCCTSGHPTLFGPHVSEINWNVELRKIEREFDGLPPERSRTQIRLQKIQEMVAREQFEERLALVGAWARLVLVGTLATSLFWWPYGRDCGFPLVAFLISNLMVIIGGLSIGFRAWRDHLVWQFVGSAMFMLVAWTIIASHTLPRVGYSTVPSATAGWACSD